MTGTGACVFVAFSNRSRTAQQALKEQLPEVMPAGFCCKGMNQSPFKAEDTIDKTSDSRQAAEVRNT